MSTRPALILAVAGALLIAAPVAAAEPAAGFPDPCEIGIVTFSATDVATNLAVEGAESQAAANGCTSTAVDAQGSVDQANTAMQNLVQKGVDAVVVTVFDSASLAAGLAATKEAGLPVCSEGGGPADGMSLDYDIALGEVNAERIVEDMGGEGSLLVLTYSPGKPARLRYASLQEALADAPNIKETDSEITIPGHVETSRAATIAWLAAHPAGEEPLAIWTVFDDSAEGVVSALQEQDRTDVAVYSWNGTKAAMANILEGWQTTTVWLDLTAVGEACVASFPEIWAAGDSWEAKSLPGDYILVDETNIEEFLVDHPELDPRVS